MVASKGEILIEPNVGRCVHSFFNHIKNNLLLIIIKKLIFIPYIKDYYIKFIIYNI